MDSGLVVCGSLYRAAGFGTLRAYDHLAARVFAQLTPSRIQPVNPLPQAESRNL